MSAPLRLVVQASSDPDQATIATHPDDLSTERYDATYVRLSGYCGPYKPELFAAAPALLAALQDMGARYGLSEQAREALAAAGVEMPKPIQIGNDVDARSRATVSGRSSGSEARSPVTPSRLMR